jgi:HAMP domain-containing protein
MNRERKSGFWLEIIAGLLVAAVCANYAKLDDIGNRLTRLETITQLSLGKTIKSTTQETENYARIKQAP